MKKLNEAYQRLDRDEFDNDYDYQFGNWALNEVPIRLNDEEKEEARNIYGNSLKGSKNGVFFRGGRINTKEDLEHFKSLKSGDFIDLKMMSATGSYSEALSFAQYVKSYDEMTMFHQLRASLEHGSAGEFGSYVIELKPKAENVIFSTYSGEMSRTAESEVVLDGKVEVHNIEIFDVLTKDNYIDQFNSIKDISGLAKNDFFDRWLNHKKLEIPEASIVSKLNQLVKSTDDLFLILNVENSRVLNSQTFMNWLDTRLSLLKVLISEFEFESSGDGDYFSIQRNGKELKGRGKIWKYLTQNPKLKSFLKTFYEAQMKKWQSGVQKEIDMYNDFIDSLYSGEKDDKYYEDLGNSFSSGISLFRVNAFLGAYVLAKRYKIELDPEFNDLKNQCVSLYKKIYSFALQATNKEFMQYSIYGMFNSTMNNNFDISKAILDFIKPNLGNSFYSQIYHRLNDREVGQYFFSNQRYKNKYGDLLKSVVQKMVEKS